MKSWVSSAFGEFSPTPSSSKTSTSRSATTRNTTGSRATQQQLNSSRVTTITRSATTVVTSQLSINENLKIESKPKASVQFAENKVAAEKSRNQIEQCLADKYSPTSRAELVVNKSKIEQLSSLIDEITNKSRGSILLIDGPTGCGKTVSTN